MGGGRQNAFEGPNSNVEQCWSENHSSYFGLPDLGHSCGEDYFSYFFGGPTLVISDTLPPIRYRVSTSSPSEQSRFLPLSYNTTQHNTTVKGEILTDM